MSVTSFLIPNDHNTDLSVIVVNYNTGFLFERWFSALDAARGHLNIQVIVVDNASRDDSVEILRTKYPTVEIIQNASNVGFGRANNQAIGQARGRYILLLNTDAFVSSDTLSKTINFMNGNLQCGVLGVKLIGEDGSLQRSCRYFPTPWNLFLTATGFARYFPNVRLVDDLSWDHESTRECDWVPGCYYLVRREVVVKIGLFDPCYFLYYEEVDHCRAVRAAGWSVIYYPFTQVIHIGGESAKTEGLLTQHSAQISYLQIESELIYFRKHHGLTGILKAILLTIIADALLSLKALVRGSDVARACSAIKHTRTVLRILAATKFASLPTR
jgi:N-acetylglucosaminyl-diphospho-decaprenol L-rhamnosyltransferase